MRTLNDTITRLTALSNRPLGTSDGSSSGLRELVGFGFNPGALRGLCHLPLTLAGSAPLVVVLHGCTQTAGDYDRGAGWSALADELGFAVLFPEQQRANNPNLCFNWFNRDDIRRDGGEALSIRQMIATLVTQHRLDPARVFVTGLSAGGAMTSVMLATYPEVFAGGAIIAGLPFGTATSMPQAFDRMRAHGGPSGQELGALVAAASPHAGPWPTISVWHGGADATVSVGNADLIVEQWRRLHGLPATPSRAGVEGRHTHRVWSDASGRDVIEEHRIAGLGHGTPLRTSGAESVGVAGPYMLEAGISSTREIARFWGLSSSATVEERATVGTPTITPAFRPLPAQEAAERATDPGPRTPSRQYGIGGVIEDALRAAGLMR